MFRWAFLSVLPILAGKSGITALKIVQLQKMQVNKCSLQNSISKGLLWKVLLIQQVTLTTLIYETEIQKARIPNMF